MRKVLLTVLMVSSLLAFNACKKDGAVGPVGPAGPTGATGAAGAAGAVGAAGAKGADGTKILTGATAPVAADGVVGDYYLQKTATATILWGPKVAAGWPTTGTSLGGANGATGATGANGATGAAGATGATGTNGTQFLAGAGAPTNAIGATGDYYFDTNTSTFYGPKLADGTWGANVLPLGSSFSAKTYVMTRGFEELVEGTRSFGQDLVPTYSNYNIFSSYMINAGDLIRINQFPARADGTGGFSENREMVFESAPGSNIFNSVAAQASQLGRSTQELSVNPILADVSDANKQVGAKFRYSRNTVNPLAEFTLTQNDIDRLKENAGASFGYLTYAKALPSSIALGSNLVFATSKNVQVKTSTTRFFTTYTARTRLNLNAIPNLEKYKQDGKVFLKYRYYNSNTVGNNTVINHPGADAGWADITNYINGYATAGTTNTTAFTTPLVTNVNPFGLNTGAGLTGYGGAYGAINHPAGTGVLGAIGSSITVGANQVATVVNINTGTVTNRTTNLDGNVIINWTISSGVSPGLAATNIGPDQISNPGSVADPVTAAFTAPSAGTALYIVRGGPAPNTPLSTYNYYSAQVTIPTLTATDNAGAPIVIGAGDLINVNGNRGGVEASYFTATKLVKVQVFVIPGDVIVTLKAKGVNTDNLSEIAKNIKL